MDEQFRKISYDVPDSSDEMKYVYEALLRKVKMINLTKK